MKKKHVDSNSFQLTSLRPQPLTEGEDFYREGAAIVFTARYHLRRGYCCASGCRHCPYADESGESLKETKCDASK